MSSLAIVYSRAFQGFNAPLVSVEAHLTYSTIPRFSIVGLPETAVKESKERVRSALMNSKFHFPTGRITVNLAPADIPKEGGRFDLAIAIGVLAASGQIPLNALPSFEFAGELALSGAIRRVHAALPFALATKRAKRSLVIARENADEAALPSHLTVLPADHLLEVCAHLTGRALLVPHSPSPQSMPLDLPDLSEVKGHFQAKRALEVAAAGGHSVMMIGPPGTGKTMLAQRFPGLLPAPNEDEALEIAAIYSLMKITNLSPAWRQRPFRAPHHTASYAALVGGNNPPVPGEVSLAHQGVLFLDELPEFNPKTLEALREPLENGAIVIARAGNTLHFPARFQLITAMNPCPCGYEGDSEIACRCTPEKIKKYQSRVSGPLLDRIDLHLTLPRLTPRELLLQETIPGPSSESIRNKAETTRLIQFERQGKLNSHLSSKEIMNHLILSDAIKKLLDQAIVRFHLSPRAYYRLLRISRTIADLGQCEQIQLPHLEEALSFRSTMNSRHMPLSSQNANPHVGMNG